MSFAKKLWDATFELDFVDYPPCLFSKNNSLTTVLKSTSDYFFFENERILLETEDEFVAKSTLLELS